MRKILGFGKRARRVTFGLALGVGALAATSACRTTQVPAGAAMRVSADEAGAPDATQAVERFLLAARAPDTRTMALLFGDAAGTIATRAPAADVEKRMQVLACYLAHDRFRVIDRFAGAGQELVTRVELSQRDLAATTRITVVPGPRGRWFVREFDIQPLGDFCRPRG